MSALINPPLLSGRRDEIVWIPDPERGLFAPEPDIWKPKGFSQHHVEWLAQPVVDAISTRVDAQLEAAKPARWEV